MKITVFTGNQPRHIRLIEQFAEIADTVYAIQECTTVFPGKIQDFYNRSDIMQRYFAHVLQAEEAIFGRPRFTPANVRQLILKDGDLNLLTLDDLKPALQSDVYVVFGASYIKGPLIDYLMSQRAYNIHMGTSPYYRGSSCNFWALYDDKPEYVGATIHLLSKGLDSGAMLFHALPEAKPYEAFQLGMAAVKTAQDGLIHYLQTGALATFQPIPQDKTQELRYTRNAQFTDEVASAYLSRLSDPDSIHKKLLSRDLSRFLHPFEGKPSQEPGNAKPFPAWQT